MNRLPSSVRDRYYSTLYAKAQNLRPLLRAAYDAALSEVDFLVMPTTTTVAPKYVAASPVSESALSQGNLPVFDMTGHPAISLPASHVDGLPVGVHVVGPRFGDARMLAFARTYEKAYGWFPSVAA